MVQSMRKNRRSRSSAFSLIELVIVVVIIAIIGAIAIPKMSRGAAGAGDAALIQDLAVLRSALDLYQAENNGTYPTTANVYNALTEYNDGNGNLSATKTGAYVYGPYLRAVPNLPVGNKKGQNGITDGAAYAAQGTSAGSSANAGWAYTPLTGQITANTTTEADASTKLYNTY
jgi:general secretion pathway protein G